MPIFFPNLDKQYAQITRRLDQIMSAQDTINATTAEILADVAATTAANVVIAAAIVRIETALAELNVPSSVQTEELVAAVVALKAATTAATAEAAVVDAVVPAPVV